MGLLIPWDWVGGFQNSPGDPKVVLRLADGQDDRRTFEVKVAGGGGPASARRGEHARVRFCAGVAQNAANSFGNCPG